MNKLFIGLLMLLAGTLGLFATVCGGFFFFGGFVDWIKSGYGGGIIAGFLMGIVPGGLLLWCAHSLWKYDKSDKNES